MSVSTNAPSARDERLIRMPEVMASVQLGRTGWLDLVKAKKAPQPIKIGRAAFWVHSEVQAFIAERIERSRNTKGAPK